MGSLDLTNLSIDDLIAVNSALRSLSINRSSHLSLSEESNAIFENITDFSIYKASADNISVEAIYTMFPSLEVLNATSSGITGDATEVIGSSTIEFLALGGNSELTGTLADITPESNLETFYGWGTKITLGQLPNSEITQSLLLLDMSDNDLFGTDISSLSTNFPSLTNINFTRTNVSGDVSSLLESPVITTLALGGNPGVTGVTTNIGEMVSLEKLYVWNTGVSGSLDNESGFLELLVSNGGVLDTLYVSGTPSLALSDDVGSALDAAVAFGTLEGWGW